MYTPDQYRAMLAQKDAQVFDKLYKKSAVRKASKHKFNSKKTATSNLKMGRKFTRVNKYSKKNPNITIAQAVKATGTGSEELDKIMNLFAQDITSNLRGKARQWAIETRAMMKEVSPVMTGNLRDSIKILNDEKAGQAEWAEELNVDDAKGRITYTVGIDEKAILPPPKRKHVITGYRKGTMHTMSDYNYAGDANDVIIEKKSEGYQGYEFLRNWQRIAEKNMERIFR